MKGQGANVEITRSVLASHELKVLQVMFENNAVTLTARDWQNELNTKEDPWNIRKVVSALSVLHGMDLIKSSEDSRTDLFTSDEYECPSVPPYYWVSREGSPWYKRADNVIKNNGDLKQIKDPIWDSASYQLKLWPWRPVTLSDVELEYLNDDKYWSKCSQIMTDTWLKILPDLKEHDVVRVTFENLGPRPVFVKASDIHE